MRTRPLFAAILAILASPLQAGIRERVYVQSHPAPGEAVLLDMARGLVRVETGQAGGGVELEVILRLQPGVATQADDSRLEAVFARLAPRVRADARRVRIDISDTKGAVWDWDPALQAAIEARLTVPPGVALRVESTAASLVFGERHVGDVSVRGDSGSLVAQVIEGDLAVSTRAGSITVTEVTGRSDLRSETGHVLAGRLLGPASLRTSTGSVEVQQALGEIRMRGDDADLILGLAAPLPPLIDLATSAGSLTLQADHDLAFSIDASAGLLGRVKVRGLTATSARRSLAGRSSLRADFNGGGVVARLRGSGADISLIGREPMPE